MNEDDTQILTASGDQFARVPTLSNDPSPGYNIEQVRLIELPLQIYSNCRNFINLIAITTVVERNEFI